MSNSISLKKAALITFITKYSNIIIQLFLNSILARLLTPQDYGIVAVISIFTGFFLLIADMGIGPAIIQNKELNDNDISSIFNFTVVSGIIIGVLFCIFSYPISFFYKNSVYVPLGFLMSISIFFNVINIVPNALLLKEKEFRLIGIRTVIITFFCGGITCILAYLNFKYYAIVINSILIALFTVLYNLYKVKIKPSLLINKNSINKIKNFSTFQFGFSFINYFSRNLDNLLIGKVIGQNQLGYYDKAYKLMLYPVQNLTHVITPVLHPILSDYQNDKEIIYNKYLIIIKILSLLGVFFSVFCYFSAEEIVLIMFGQNWIESIVSFKILSISIVIQMVLSTTGVIFQSIGAVKLLFKTGIINTLITISFILFGLGLRKIECVSIGVVVGYLLNFFISFYFLINNGLKQNLIKFYREFITTIIIGILMIFTYKMFNIKNTYIFMSLMYKGILGVIVFILGLIITKEYKIFLKILKR